MAFDLVIEFPVLALLVEQAAESVREFTKFSHPNSSVLCSEM
jgi:hypothetical protein